MNDAVTFMVKLEMPQELAEAFEAHCEQRGLSNLNLTAWGREGEPVCDITAYFTDLESAESALPVLQDLVSTVFPDINIECRLGTIPTEDWQNAWKKFFKPAQVSRRVVVRPSWEEWSGSEECVQVVIDPGMTFGTGLHPTTRACISFIDRIGGEGRSFLDAGCGSGILSIAAVKLGYRPVSAFDIDPMAVKCSLENMARNGIESGFDVDCRKLEEISLEEVFDVVAVNILSPIILANVQNIAAAVKQPQGFLCLAGIHSEQFDSVRDVFLKEGFCLNDSIQEDKWRSGLFCRQ